MTEKEFANIYGDEQQEVTKNFVTKSISSNYNIKDAFIEFCDNGYDARIFGEPLNMSFDYNPNEHTINVRDNGTGINDDRNLFKLGGTNKENAHGKIGKYGIGVLGSISSIAKECFYDKSEVVVVTYSSANNGTYFEKSCCFKSNGNITIGKTDFSECDKNEHFTNIKFTNVCLENNTEIIQAIEETFEITLQTDLNITFNGRHLGKSGFKTFIGDEIPETINVGNDTVDVKYRLIGGSNNKSDKTFIESGLRFYSKNTNRLLAKDTQFWNWFADKSAQPTICGLRVGIWIDDSLESFNKFGIKPAKNGISYKKYHAQKDFKELKDKLVEIYNKAANTTHSDNSGEYKIGTRVFTKTSANIKGIYKYDEEANLVYIKSGQPKLEEIAQLINDYINLKKRFEKKKQKKDGK